MDELLRFLVKRLPYLYKEFGFRIVDSEFSPVNGGAGQLVLVNNHIRIILVCDRGQVFMEFQSFQGPLSKGKFSYDIVLTHVTGKVWKSGVLDKKGAIAIRSNMENIVQAFTGDQEGLLRQMKILEANRTKRLFG